MKLTGLTSFARWTALSCWCMGNEPRQA